MNAFLWIVPFLGLTALIVYLFVALQRWTAAKQQQLSADEFRVWFQKNFLGVPAEGDTPTNSGAAPGNSRKARLDRPKL